MSTIKRTDLIEKVRKGAELCRYDPDPGQECKMLVSCDICPYWSDETGCNMTQLFNDMLTVLNGMEGE